ncbi:MAG: citrate lyase holo-[acyl-carrier protein] synthase [Oscillospiraceae bacterium]|nr:citrate lyase holo-[acyl-carrier protein] synthase [Oscillospiraceae bacterium]
MREVTLQEVLEARERRAEAQRQLLKQLARPLISFTMNIPGPVKNSPLIRRAFSEGLRMLDDALGEAGVVCVSRQLTHADTGNEFLCTVKASAAAVKEICTRIEDGSPMGRLFDMDVIGLDGQKLAREEERRCLVCGAVGRGCASRRLHSLEELNAAVTSLLREGLLAADAERVDATVTHALLEEVATTPKPGLVDRNNNGAHLDMTLLSFQMSASALRGYWKDCFLAGAETAELPAREAFTRMRALGMEAERKMLAATRGVNTHKGAIFTLGTICGAIGRLWQPEAPCGEPERIAEACAALCADAVEADFTLLEKGKTARTAGERLYLHSGLRGIRGEVAAGLPAVRETGLPILDACLDEGMSRNDAGVITLLYLIARGEDTNMIKRGGLALAREMSSHLRDELRKNVLPTMERVRQLDEIFIRRNLSPGGCADLLAVSYFLHDWKQQTQSL